MPELNALSPGTSEQSESSDLGTGLDERISAAFLARVADCDAPSEKAIASVDGRSSLVTQAYGARGLSFAFDAYGLRIGVSLEDAEYLGNVLNRLPYGWRPALFDNLIQHYSVTRLDEAGERCQHRVVDKSGRYFVVNGLEPLFDSLESSIEDFIAENATPWLFLHAGVVGWRGRAIVLPGRSFAGKSTLTAALVSAGATYYSDEFAILDPDGNVHPFPRRLSLRTRNHDGWQLRRVEMPGVSERSAGLPPLTIAAIALLSYDPNQAFRTEKLDYGPAIMALCEHCVAIRRRPADTLKVLGSIVRSAAVVRGYRGEADESVPWLLAMTDNEPWVSRCPGEHGKR